MKKSWKYFLDRKINRLNKSSVIGCRGFYINSKTGKKCIDKAELLKAIRLSFFIIVKTDEFWNRPQRLKGGITEYLKNH